MNFGAGRAELQRCTCVSVGKGWVDCVMEGHDISMDIFSGSHPAMLSSWSRCRVVEALANLTNPMYCK